MPFQLNAFQTSAFQQVPGPIAGTLAASFVPPLVASLAGVVRIVGAIAGTFSPPMVAAISVAVRISAFASASINPPLVADAIGTSDVVVILNPRNSSEGTAYLVEMQAANRDTGVATTFYYSTDGFNTLPSDSPANQHYDARIISAGNYERSLFASGTTSGEVSVGAGYIELVNVDGKLDLLRDYAFDGYSLRILTILWLNPVYADATPIFFGTVEQVELSWERARILIRDRLAELDVPHQSTLFAGTTIAGGMNEAEGLPDDLKGKPKPLTYGAPAQVIPAVANAFDLIYSVGANGLNAVSEVRDKGVLLTANGNDYTTVAALRTATIASGQWATAKNLGLIRLGSTPQGQVTCAPVYGANAAARTAGQLAKAVLLRAGFVEGTHFLTKDITTLDTVNNAEIGYFVGTEEAKTLDVVRKILGSIGATIVPDTLGVFRMVRFSAPQGYPAITLTKAELLEGQSGGRVPLQLLSTGDEGRGVPTWKVNVKYRYNWAVTSANELSTVSVSTAYKAFAPQEWRTAIAKNDALKAIHKLSPELNFETYLVSEAAAQAEANRQLALHGTRRDRYRVSVKSYLLEGLDLNTTIRLQVDRFDLSAGKNFVVIGINENHETRITTVDLWG